MTRSTRRPARATTRRTTRRRTTRRGRYRRGRWRHHRFWRPGRWYRGYWWGLRFVTWAVWVTWTPRTYVVYGSTYYYYNGVWYTRAVHEEETVYVITYAPEGHEVDSLSEDAEVIEVDGQTYYLSEHTFYQKIQRDGEDVYVVVDPPAGAQVASIPEDVVEHEEGDVTVYQYDETFYTRETDEEGNQHYEVQPRPPEEELDELPADAVSFVVDEETYYYADRGLYVAAEGGGYVMSEPALGGVAPQLPDGATVINEAGETYFQLDTVFFREVESGSGTGYEVAPAPDGSETLEEEDG